MMNRNPLKPGQQVIIYKDHLNNKGAYGTARLIELVQDGLTFIPDSVPESIHYTRVYKWQIWKIEWEVIFPFGEREDVSWKTKWKIRSLHTIGLSAARDFDPTYTQHYSRVDRFLSIHGIEIY